jgi:hypothetical protein
MSVKAKVRNGRLVVDEATELPDGTEVELVAVMEHGDDALRPEDRAALHHALAQADADIADGRLVDGDDVIARLKAQSG